MVASKTGPTVRRRKAGRMRKTRGKSILTGRWGLTCGFSPAANQWLSAQQGITEPCGRPPGRPSAPPEDKRHASRVNRSSPSGKSQGATSRWRID
jgi:hypothetical protein